MESTLLSQSLSPGSLHRMCCVCLVTQWCLTLCNTVNCSPSGFSVLGDSPGRNTGVGCHALLQGISQPRSPTLQADSLPSEPPGKPKNNRLGSLSLLQGIFQTQESHQGLLHCRRILSQSSSQGSLHRMGTQGQRRGGSCCRVAPGTEYHVYERGAVTSNHKNLVCC